MKIYEKYIFSRIAGPMLIITLGITGIAWLSRSLKFVSSDSEIIVFKASGISNFNIMKPAINFSILCTIISFFIAFYFLPASYREFKDMQSFIKNNYASILLQEGVFSKPTKDLTILTNII